MNRIDILKSYINEDPNDPFNHYALALEVSKDNLPLLIQQLNAIVVHWPEYLPTYYSLGNALAEDGQLSESLKILQTGIDLSLRLQELKTNRELTGLKQRVESELEP